MAAWTLILDALDRYGREQVRTVNLTIDIRDFTDKAGFVWLLIAANPRLSIRDIQVVLASVGEQHERPHGWISRHRWMFHGTGAAGMKRNADGLDERAHQLMARNPKMSSRSLAKLLRENGVPRSKDWVRKYRSGY